VSSFDYAKTAETATRLLARFGRSAPLTRTAEGVYDTESGSTDEGSTTVYPAFGAKFDYEQREIDGTTILQGDARIYISPSLAVIPEAGDTITFGSEVWQVVRSRPLEPAGAVVLHDVQVRK
jgi:hypothetical protein